MKSAALPDVSETSASRDPEASVTTLAVTPRFWLLIWLTTAERDWVPSVVMVAGDPVPTVMVKLPAGSAEALLANTPEVHEAVVARLLTTTT